MALPVPNLDDRRFDELLREARERIAALCPDWTDFNPSDPGMTLVELMAWLTDLTLYRINRIPERSFAVFLNMLGVRLRPPEAARTWLLFEPKAKAATGLGGAADDASAATLIDVGTAAQARREGGPPLVFSTLEQLNLTGARPVAAIFTEGERRPSVVLADDRDKGSFLSTVVDRTPLRLVAPEGTVEHLFFLGHRIGDTREKEPVVTDAPHGGLLHIDVGVRTPTDKGVEIEWERVAAGSPEGERDPLRRGWRPWVPDSDGTDGLRRSGRITFRITGPIFSRRHEGGAVWLRGRLLRAQPDALPEIAAIGFRYELPAAAAQPPERVCQRTAQHIFSEQPVPRPATVDGVDDAVEVRPFGAEPVPEAALLIGGPLLDREPGAEIAVSFVLRSEGSAAPGAPPPELRWETFGKDGSWTLLGRSTPEGLRKGVGGEAERWDFTDGTNALTRSGTVTFRRPDEAAPFPVLGEPGAFLRVRLAAGTPHRAVLRDIRIAFTDPSSPFDLIMADTYGRLETLHQALAEGGAVRPFDVRREEDAGPTLLIGLSDRPANHEHRLFLDLHQPRDAAASPGGGLRPFFGAERPGRAGPRTSWSYSGEGGWKPLPLVEDGTRDLTMRGVIAFNAPDDWVAATLGGARAHWLRARLDPALRPAERPSLAAVATNCVEAAQAEVVRDVVLSAPATDEPWQRIALPVRPALPGLVLAVRELDDPGEAALAKLRNQPGARIEEEEEKGGGAPRAAWVRWEEVPDFFRSDADSRHYVFDPVEGTIAFGDGRHGRIPPSGANRIKVVRHLRGGGAAGNAAARTIDQLVKPDPRVDRVFNPVAAEGGTDAEPVEEALRRGPYALRHRERAVTAEDYVRLAAEASRNVARASCSFVDGQAQVLIIPDDGTETPSPGRFLVEAVQSYLEERRTIGTRLRVTGPDYVEITASIKVALRPAYAARMQEVRRSVEERLRGFVHPVHGGPDVLPRGRDAPREAPRGGRQRRPAAADGQTGWPLGRSLHLSELYYVVEQVEGVDYAERIELALAGEIGTRSKIALAPTALPHFFRISVEQAR